LQAVDTGSLSGFLVLVFGFVDTHNPRANAYGNEMPVKITPRRPWY
jgi:hypothetical protein